MGHAFLAPNVGQSIRFPFYFSPSRFRVIAVIVFSKLFGALNVLQLGDMRLYSFRGLCGIVCCGSGTEVEVN